MGSIGIRGWKKRGELERVSRKSEWRDLFQRVFPGRFGEREEIREDHTQGEEHRTLAQRITVM
jgi:hypothetical protein